MLDLRAIVRAPLYVPSPLQAYLPNPGRHRVEGELILVDGGVLEPGYSYVAVVGELPPDELFARAGAFFGENPYAVTLEVEAAPALSATLQACGWLLDEEEPALALALLPPSDEIPVSPPELTIELVTTEARLADFRAITRTPRERIPSLRAATDPAVALLVGYVDGEPVATARLSCCGAVGEIMGVTTLPHCRRRGYGAALTWAAIAAGVERGCTAMTLTATEMGLPLYRKMGFVPVCTYRTYVPPGL